MRLAIEAILDYDFAEPSDVLLAVEAAALPDQRVIEQTHIIDNAGPLTNKVGGSGVGRAENLLENRLPIFPPPRLSPSNADLRGVDAPSYPSSPSITIRSLLVRDGREGPVIFAIELTERLSQLLARGCWGGVSQKLLWGPTGETPPESAESYSGNGP